MLSALEFNDKPAVSSPLVCNVTAAREMIGRRSASTTRRPSAPPPASRRIRMPQRDAWSFSAPSATPPREQTHVLLGMLPAGDYWAVATTRVTWQDDSEASYLRNIDIVLDVDGFDLEGSPADWDSGIVLGRGLANYQANGAHSETRDLVGQTVFSIPSGGLELKLGLADQSNVVAHSSVALLDFRLIVIEVKTG